MSCVVFVEFVVFMLVCGFSVYLLMFGFLGMLCLGGVNFVIVLRNSFPSFD